ncbi:MULTISPECIES: hypothetical protein [unclassified Bradyrhizobium]|uniref:hypothetical protein n=1 Tax=unclassified Bradyrhizobium TaxID=2631580 RepID=UPI001CD2F784|nr:MULTISPECIES: hypothetical protein [unclassified Bradyrhizobium]MCA1502073.1 hypothetical protein [Bradyrhizobium sp. NBAIM14]MCA1537916.1 hypothetical protein [Bradyrhizobium sp. NBAIM03]
MSRLSDMLRTQRFDDYRFYHQSTVNQTLHSRPPDLTDARSACILKKACLTSPAIRLYGPAP